MRLSNFVLPFCVLTIALSATVSANEDDLSDRAVRTLVIRYNPDGIQLTRQMLSITLDNQLAVDSSGDSESIVKSIRLDSDPATTNPNRPGGLSTFLYLTLNKEVDRKQIDDILKSMTDKLQSTFDDRLYRSPRALLERRRHETIHRLKEAEDSLLQRERNYEQLQLKYGSLETLRENSAELNTRERELKLRQMVETKRSELAKRQLAILQKKLAEQHELADELAAKQAELATQGAKNPSNNAVKLSAGNLSSVHQRLLETRQSVLRRLESTSATFDELEMSRALATHESTLLREHLASWKADSLEVAQKLVTEKRAIYFQHQQHQTLEERVMALTNEIENMQRVTVELWD